MTALLPTRISIYHFLIEDTLPIDSILADAGQISIPQARIITENGVQVIVSALLAYEQKYGSVAVIKKLLHRSQVRELRNYNAFNLQTMATAFQYGPPIYDTLFDMNDSQVQTCDYLAQLSQVPATKVKQLLKPLSLLCIRELAILVEFSQLDADDLSKWFKHQNQFLKLTQIIETIDISNQTNLNTLQAETPAVVSFYQPIAFNDRLHTLTGYTPPATELNSSHNQIPSYAKAIGRNTSSLTTGDAAAIESNGLNILTTKVVDKSNNNDILTFATIPGIHLPYLLWLLQLAKIADIYLTRNRLKIAPERQQAPLHSAISFGFAEENNIATASESPIEYDSKPPFWRNPVLVFLVVTIGVLGLMAFFKYHYKIFEDAIPNSKAPTDGLIQTDRQTKDIAVIRLPENEK